MPLPVDTRAVRIEWPGVLLNALREDGGDETSASDLAAKACIQLGRGLLVGQGESGLGIFDDFSCYLTRPKRKPSFLAGTKQEHPAAWTLRFRPEGDLLHLDTYYTPPGGIQRLVGSTALPLGTYTQDLLRDKIYASLTAALVLDSLPALRKFTPLTSPAAAPLALALGVDQPPQQTLHLGKLQLYTLAYDPNNYLWLPHLIGSAKIIGTGNAARWQLIVREQAATSLYIHQSAGPGAQQAALLSLLAKREETLFADQTSAEFQALRAGAEAAVRFALLNTLNSGYVGLRVGKELLAAGSILPPGTMIGVIGEERAGPLAGLRLYYDTVPRHGATVNGQPLWVQWSRLVAGYNFGMSVPWIINRLELAPKIGVWNVDSRLPEFGATGNVAYRSFVLNNALSLGFETAAVWESADLLLRLWYGRDLSIPIAKSAGAKSTVTSSRLGFDGLFKGPPVAVFTKVWRLSYLVFIYHEDLSFAQQSQQDGRFNLEFSSSYAGGGLSLAW